MTISQTSEKWLSWVQVGIISGTMLGTLGLSIAGKPAAPFAAVGLGVLLLLRFGDIASLTLKAFGAEAVVERAERAANDADKATGEAEQAIEALKDLGKALVATSLSLAALRGNTFASFLGTTLGMRDLLVGSLEEMGCTPKEIEDVTAVFKSSLVGNMLKEALQAMPAESSSAIAVPTLNLIDDLPKNFDIARAKTLFEEQGFTDEAKVWLDRIELFIATGDIKVKAAD